MPPPQRNNGGATVFVGNINYDATEDQLKDIFSQVGVVVNFRVVYDQETGRPKGYGFCEYEDAETAMSARRNLNGYELNGRQLRVDFTESDKPGNAATAAGGAGSGGTGGGNTPGGPQGGSGGGAGGVTKNSEHLLPDALSGPNPSLAMLALPQIHEVMLQLKRAATEFPNDLRDLLANSPQLAHAVLQGQIMLGMIPLPPPPPTAPAAVPGVAGPHGLPGPVPPHVPAQMPSMSGSGVGGSSGSGGGGSGMPGMPLAPGILPGMQGSATPGLQGPPLGMQHGSTSTVQGQTPGMPGALQGMTSGTGMHSAPPGMLAGVHSMPGAPPGLMPAAGIHSQHPHHQQHQQHQQLQQHQQHQQQQHPQNPQLQLSQHSLQHPQHQQQLAQSQMPGVSAAQLAGRGQGPFQGGMQSGMQGPMGTAPGSHGGRAPAPQMQPQISMQTPSAGSVIPTAGGGLGPQQAQPLMEQAALLKQVMEMTPAQIEQLPPDQQAQVLQLQALAAANSVHTGVSGVGSLAGPAGGHPYM